MSFSEIKQALSHNQYRITDHGWEEMEDDDLVEAQLIQCAMLAEMIEDYPKDYPYPSCLVLGWIEDMPVHMVWAYNTQKCYALLVTAYQPDPKRWTPDYRKRVQT